DTTANGSRGTCVVCTPTEGCSGGTPFCKSDQTACIECRDNQDCATHADCGSATANVCTAVASGDITTANTQVNAVLAATDTTTDYTTPMPVSGVTVTYLKPAIAGAAAPDVAGFFVQADATTNTTGSASIFVAVDPTTLTPSPKVGDRVSFD